MLEVYWTVRHKIWTSVFGPVFCVLLSDHVLQKRISSYGIPDPNIDFLLSTFMWQPSWWAVTSIPLFLAQQQLNLPLPPHCACSLVGVCANHCLELSSLYCYIWKGDWAEVQEVHSVVGIGDPRMKLWQRRIVLQKECLWVYSAWVEGGYYGSSVIILPSLLLQMNPY